MNMYKNDETIVAPATIPGSGAISVIRVSGTSTFAILDKAIKFKQGKISDSPGYKIKFGTIEDNGKILDEVLVSVFRNPNSYTGEDSAEISCHASSYIAERIISIIISLGARIAEPGEFTRRAYVNGKMDLAQAEAVADVIASSGEASLRIAMNQLKGGISNELKKIRKELVDVTALLELELDFSEEEVEFADRTKFKNSVEHIIKHFETLTESFRLGNAIKNGVPVAIAGPANTGKSTLLNALLGEERSIVSDIAGTTRDTIEETLNIDGIIFRFIDTAGIRETTETVEKIGIERTFKKIEEAEIILAMADCNSSEDEILSELELLLSKVDFSFQKVFVLLNKIDLNSKDDCGNKIVNTKNNIVLLLKSKGFILDESQIIPISAKSGYGIDKLKKLLAKSKKNIVSDVETVLVSNMRHYQELTRAKTALERVKSGIEAGIPTDFVAQDLRETLHCLGAITGQEIITPDEILGSVFSRFCIGK